MNVDGIRLGERPFHDDVNYPRGFSRSGDFSINDSAILKDYGTTMKQLYDGTLLPVNEAEKQFVEVVNGKAEARNAYERVWLKYIQKTSKRTFHTLNSKVRSGSNNNIESSEYSLEL